MSKGGQKLQSGRLTHLVDQQICWYGWCWLAVPFVVSVPFDDKICWYGHAFRINILCNWPILLMLMLMFCCCAMVVVQFMQCSLLCLLCNMACIHVQGASWAIFLHWLFVCTCIAWVWSNCCVPGMSENLKSGLVHRNLKSSFQPFSFWYGRCK